MITCGSDVEPTCEIDVDPMSKLALGQCGIPTSDQRSKRRPITLSPRGPNVSMLSGGRVSDEEEDGAPPSRTHKLSVEDEFLSTIIKLRLGLFNKDIAMQFGISVSAVSKIFITWINLMYIRLGSLKIFPTEMLP